MDWESLKSFILSFWARYSVSWVLKALAALGITDSMQSRSEAEQIAAGAGAVIAVVIDVWHSRQTAKANQAKGNG